jgi:hypothetical protein
VNAELEFTGKNLQGKSFKGVDLQQANFSGSDLRGADFSGAKLMGADFSKSVTGMRISSKIMIFIVALIFSLFSGYIAMLVASTTWGMIKSADKAEHIGGYVTLVFLVFFAAIASWKGLFRTIKKVLPFMIAIPVILGLFMVLLRLSSGKGSFYGLIALLLLVFMFVVGTISRATAGTLASTVLFIIVAIGGGVFGRTVGGGIGTVVLAISCAYISKNALKADNPDSILRKIALTVGTMFGTSFKNADLKKANFIGAVINNTDFSNANLEDVDWTDAKKQFVLGEK